MLILSLLATSAAAPQTYPDARALSVVLPIGDVTISSGSGGVTVTPTQREWSEQCVLTMTETSGEARIRVTVSDDGRRKKRSDGCVLDLDVQIPPEVPVELDVGIGNITLRGLSGAVELDLGVGDLTTETTGMLEADIGAGCIRGSASLLDADIGAGSVEVTGLSGDARLSVSAGDVGLTWLTLPDDIDISVGAGSVLVALPDGSLFEADLETGVGGVSSLLEPTDGAESQVEIDVGVGSIIIR